MSDKYALYSERMWLIATIGAFVFASYMVYTEGSKEWGYYVMSGIAGSMYFFRRMLRRRFERNRQQ